MFCEGNPAFRTHSEILRSAEGTQWSFQHVPEEENRAGAPRSPLMHLWIRSPDKPRLISFGRVLSLGWHETRSHFHYPWLHLPFGVTGDLLPMEEWMTDATRERVHVSEGLCICFTWVWWLSMCLCNAEVLDAIDFGWPSSSNVPIEGEISGC